MDKDRKKIQVVSFNFIILHASHMQPSTYPPKFKACQLITYRVH